MGRGRERGVRERERKKKKKEEEEVEEEKEEKEGERGTSIACLLTCVPGGHRTCNLDMCSDWELNLQHFGLWNDAPTN